MNSNKVVVASGFFNPLHYGHVSYLQKAKDVGGRLIVIVNNDRQVERRRQRDSNSPLVECMPARDRVRTVRSLACVDAAMEAVDEDDSVAETLKLLHPDFFANGGGQRANQREVDVCNELGIRMMDGLGIEFLSLTPFTQHYDWGKKRNTSMVSLLSGDSDTQECPQQTPTKFAELWMGDHPSGPSVVKSEDGKDLGCISRTFERTPSLLGVQLAGQAKLPFLLKVISIEKALSIQAHPDRKLAERLHRERPNTYKDPNHKPEIAIALTDFEALCGFRPLSEIAGFVDAVPELASLVGSEGAAGLRKVAAAPAEAKAEDAQGDGEGVDTDQWFALKRAYSHLMHSDEGTVIPAVQALVARSAQSTTTTPGASTPTPNSLAMCFGLVRRLHSQFGDDIGIFSVFFLNYVKMGVGDCLYMPQNRPHAYLSGDIVECMATSDNVVRGGLTPKFKDIEVLCEMLHYAGGSPPRIVPQQQAPGILLYADPTLEDFQVTHLHLEAGAHQHWCFSKLGPAIGFALRGEGSVTISGDLLNLKAGVVFFLAAGVDTDFVATAELHVFVACCPPHYFHKFHPTPRDVGASPLRRQDSKK